MSGTTWSVDADATSSMLSRLDADAIDYCSANGRLVSGYDESQEAIPGSARVRSALGAMFEGRDVVPSRIAGHVSRVAAATTVSVQAVVFADEEMVTIASTGVASGSTEKLFDSARFGGAR